MLESNDPNINEEWEIVPRYNINEEVLCLDEKQTSLFIFGTMIIIRVWMRKC